MFSRSRKSDTPPAPTKFKGKESGNKSFWRRHAHDTPASSSTLPSSQVTSNNTTPFPWPSVQESGGNATAPSFGANSSPTASGSGPRRGASSNARTHANPYQTPDATGRMKMHRIRQQISRAVEDDLVTAALRLPGLPSSGRLVRFAAEKLKRKADKIKDSVAPRVLSRGPKLNWMEIQKIHRKLEKEEAGREGRVTENDNVTCVPKISEDEIMQAFRRSYDVPQVIVPGAHKGKQKAESNVNEGDTDTDTNEDTDTEDENEDKENVGHEGGSKGLERPGLGEGPIASSSSVAPQLKAPPSAPGPSKRAEEWIQLRAASPKPLGIEPMTPIKPAGRSAPDPPTTTPAVVVNMDYSSPVGRPMDEASALQQQQSFAPPSLTLPNAPVFRDQKAAQLTDCGMAQTTFQPVQVAVDPQASFQSRVPSECPQPGRDTQLEAHQLSFTPTFQQSEPPCLPNPNCRLSGQVQQQPQLPIPSPNVHPISYPQQQQQVPCFGTENRFSSSQETPFLPLPAAPSNPVSQPTSGGFPSFSFLRSAFQSQCYYAQPVTFPTRSTILNASVPLVTSTQHPRPIIRRLPVLLDDPPRRPILFGPYGIHAFIKEKPIPVYQPTPIDPSDATFNFNEEAWKTNRKRRFEEWEARQRMKPGPLDITNVPSLSKKTYSGRPPKGSEEDLVRRLEIERKCVAKEARKAAKAKRAKKAKKAKKHVRFLLPGEELDSSPVRKKRRIGNENLEPKNIPEKSAPSSSQKTEVNVPPLINLNRPDLVMPGAYELSPDMESGGKAIEGCPVINHIFSFLRDQLATYQDNKHVEGDYPA